MWGYFEERGIKPVVDGALGLQRRRRRWGTCFREGILGRRLLGLLGVENRISIHVMVLDGFIFKRLDVVVYRLCNQAPQANLRHRPAIYCLTLLYKISRILSPTTRVVRWYNQQFQSN
jgi:hypothetical protein